MTKRSGIVVVIWLVCGAIVLTGLISTIIWKLHPFSNSLNLDQWLMSLFFVMPYLIVSYAATRLHNRRAVLTIVLIVTVLFGLAGTALRLQEMEMGLWFAESRSKGGHPMACGPPPILFIIMLEYSVFFPMTLLLGLVAQIVGPRPEPEVAPSDAAIAERFSSGDPANDDRIQPDRGQIRRGLWDPGNGRDDGQFMSD